MLSYVTCAVFILCTMGEIAIVVSANGKTPKVWDWDWDLHFDNSLQLKKLAFFANPGVRV